MKKAFNNFFKITKSNLIYQFNISNRFFTSETIKPIDRRSKRLESFIEMEKEKYEINNRNEKYKPKLSPTKAIFENLKESVQNKLSKEEIEQQNIKNRPFKHLNVREDVIARVRNHYDLNNQLGEFKPHYNYTKFDDYFKIEHNVNKNNKENYDKFIGREHIDRDSIKDEVIEQFDQIINKLGYLDYREFLALNKYLVDDSEAVNRLNTVKKNLLNAALELSENSKKKEMIRSIGNDKESKLLDTVEESNELFNKYYYLLRRKALEEDSKNISLQEKINELVNIYDKKNKSIEDYRTITDYTLKDPIMDDKDFGFNSEIDHIIRQYRRSKLTSTGKDYSEIVRIVSTIFNLDSFAKSYEDVNKMNIEELDIEKKKRTLVEEENALLRERLHNAMDAKQKRDGTKFKDKGLIDNALLTDKKKYIQFLENLEKDLKGEPEEDKSKPRVRRKSLYRGSYSTLRRSKRKHEKSLPSYTKEDKLPYKIKFERLTKRRKNYIDFNYLEKKHNEDQTGETLTSATRNATDEKYNPEREQIHNSEEALFKKHKSEIILLIKYLLIVEKFKLSAVYTPSNVEVEKTIYTYLRKKLEAKTDFENKELLSNDPFLQSLLKLDNEKNNKFISDIEKIKSNYIASKTDYEKSKLLTKFDDLYARQFGFKYAEMEHNKDLKNNIFETEYPIEMKINDKIFPLNVQLKNYKDFVKQRLLIKEIVDNYYKEYKLQHMYNSLDYYTNKYKVRRRIQEATSVTNTLQEVNYLITKLAYKIADTDKQNINGFFKNNLYDFKSNSSNFDTLFQVFEAKTLGKQQVKDVNLRPVLPKILETRFNENKDLFTDEDRNKVIKSMEIVDNSNYFNSFDHFEIEVYQSMKKDPFFNNYMHNFIAFQADQKNNFEEVSEFHAKVKPRDHNSLAMQQGATHEANKIYKLMNDYSEKEMQKYYELSLKLRNNDSMDGITQGKDDKVDELLFDKSKNIDFVLSNPSLVVRASGKRKSSRALVTIRPGTGKITINNLSINKYFFNTNIRSKILLPLVVTDLLCKLDVSVIVKGGGSTGQTDAIIPGISKCLVKLDPEYKKKLDKHHFLTNDPRIVERKKPGLQKARKGQVYRRR